MSMKNSNNKIGNRTRDLPICSAVPQPTTSSTEVKVELHLNSPCTPSSVDGETFTFTSSHVTAASVAADGGWDSIDGLVKANSPMPCRAHAVPLPVRAALIHT
jgi:hypothetical protein